MFQYALCLSITLYSRFTSTSFTYTQKYCTVNYVLIPNAQAFCCTTFVILFICVQLASCTEHVYLSIYCHCWKKKRILTRREMVENDIYTKLKMGKRIENDKHTFLLFVFACLMVVFLRCVCVILFLMFAIECNMAMRNTFYVCCIYLWVFSYCSLLFLWISVFFEFFPFRLCKCKHSVHCAVSTLHKQQQSTIPNENNSYKQQAQYSDCNCFMRFVTFTIWLQLVDNGMRLLCFFSSLSLLMTFLTRDLAKRLDEQLIGLIFTDQFNAIFFSGRSLR